VRSVVYDRHGDPAQVLRLNTADAVPRPSPGEVLVRVLARPLHPGDLMGVAGQGDPGVLDPPQSPGLEGMGVVEALGQGVAGPEPGSRVAFFPVPGALREYVTAPARVVVRVPDEISDATAAVLLINTLTVSDLLRAVKEAWAGPPAPMLQTAAGSSVARLITAAAVRASYPLVNLVRSESGAAVLRARFPSIPVVTTSDPDWTDQALAALGCHPRVILDAVGGSLAARLVGLLADGGTLIFYGALSGEPLVVDPTEVIGPELRIQGVSVGRWRQARTADQQASDVASAVDLALISPDLLDIAATYDLSDYQAAVAEVSRPGKVGTVVLTSPFAPTKGGV
jgi:NADPH:quinone reductase-like Zn-dependent oxidoreductase